MVFKCGKCVVLPTKLAFSWVCGFRWQKTHTCQQLPTHWAAHETCMHGPKSHTNSPNLPRRIPANSRVMIVVASNIRSCNMGIVSSHEAQYAAGASSPSQNASPNAQSHGQRCQIVCHRCLLMRSWGIVSREVLTLRREGPSHCTEGSLVSRMQ